MPALTNSIHSHDLNLCSNDEGLLCVKTEFLKNLGDQLDEYAYTRFIHCVYIFLGAITGCTARKFYT